jgi:hypothetical protein
MVLIYTHLGHVSLPLLILVNAVLFVGIFSRNIPFQALMSTVPETTKRGSFSAINASTQQLSGGIASVVAGHIVTLGASGKLQHFDVVGYVLAGGSLTAVMLLWLLQRSLAPDAYRGQERSAAATGISSLHRRPS